MTRMSLPVKATDVSITMADGVRLAATLYLPRRRRSVRRPARGAALPQGRPHGVVPRFVRAIRRRGRVRGVPARPARHGLVGGYGDRRVPGRGTFRPPRRDRMAGDAGVVERAGRDVRDVVFRVQLAAHGCRGGARAWCGRRHVRHRRPLHRRRPLPRRRAARDRSDRLRALHGADERAAAGAGAVGRRLGGRVAAPRRRDAGVVARLAARAGRLGRCGGAVRSGSDPATRGTSESRARRCSSPAGPTATATTRSARSNGCGCRGASSPGRGATRTRPERAPGPTSTPTPRSSPSSTSISATGRPTTRRAPAQVFVRQPTHPEPDLARYDGVWRDLSAWPPPGLRWVEHRPVTGDAVDVDHRRARGAW